MKKQWLKWSVVFVLPLMAATLPWTTGNLQAHDPVPLGAQHLMLITHGGLLYDRWWAQLGKEAPKTTHPAYTKAGKQTGSSTWRCKECHGWDYKGARGAYGKGSHYSGIGGIRNMAHAPIDAIVAVMKDKIHGFGNLIPDDDLTALAHFISHGQLDMDEYIDRTTKKAKGDAANGERIYQTTCARCHGSDGKLINFHDEAKPEFIGTVATENPWETLHKLRMGQPGVPMISMLAFEIQDHVDILAYAQTLPAK